MKMSKPALSGKTAVKAAPSAKPKSSPAAMSGNGGAIKKAPSTQVGKAGPGNKGGNNGAKAYHGNSKGNALKPDVTQPAGKRSRVGGVLTNNKMK